MDAATSLVALQRSRTTLASLPDLQPATAEPMLRALAAELGLSDGQLFGLIRVAATGKTVAPPLFGTLAILGPSLTLARLDRASEVLAAAK